jgi:hypothetical protein
MLFDLADLSVEESGSSDRIRDEAKCSDLAVCWFTEGFDTLDLKGDEALLGELAS